MSIALGVLKLVFPLLTFACGVRYRKPVLQWMSQRRGFRTIGWWLTALALLLPAQLSAQATDSTPVLGTVTYRYTDSVPTAWAYTDSVAHQDTVSWAYPVPPKDTSVVGTHEPAGFRAFATVDCERIPEAGFKVQLTGGPTATGPTFSLVKDPQRGSVCQTTYPAGFVDGRAPATYWSPLPGVSDLYVRYWSKLSPNWAGHPVGFKQMIAKTRSGWQLFPRIVGTSLKAGFTAELVGNTAFPATPLTWSRDAWHLNEILLTGSGHVTYWLDGQRIVDADVPGWKPSPFTELQWRPIEGGNMGWKTPAAQTELLDDVVVKVRP